MIHTTIDAILLPGVTYRSPSGRPCQLEDGLPPNANVANFVYLDETPIKRPGRPTEEGFRLSRENWHLVRRWA